MAINTNTGDDFPETHTIQNQEEIQVMGIMDRSLLLDSSNSDFNFCVNPVKETYYCPADELFFNGMIIPTQMKEKLINAIKGHSKEEDEDEDEEDEITASTTATLIREEKTQSRSIWMFKRSSSLNCENYEHKKSSIWSLPLLFRSKSTDSSSRNCSQDYSKKNQKNNNAKVSSIPGSRLSGYSHQKPPLRNNGHVKNGVRNSNVFNVPSPYIAKGTSDLLGFGTLFRNGSIDKKIKK